MCSSSSCVSENLDKKIESSVHRIINTLLHQRITQITLVKEPMTTGFLIVMVVGLETCVKDIVKKIF